MCLFIERVLFRTRGFVATGIFLCLWNFVLLTNLEAAWVLNPAGEHSAIFITGYSGDKQYRDHFENAVSMLKEALFRVGFGEEDFVWFREPSKSKPLVEIQKTELSQRENLSDYFQTISKQDNTYDQTFIFIAGHANGSGKEMKFHLAGRDVTYQELMDWISQIPTDKLILVLGIPKAAHWMHHFEGSDRIVIIGNQLKDFDFMPIIFVRTFPKVFKDWMLGGGYRFSFGNVLQKIFEESTEAIAAWYEENGLVPTELALMQVESELVGEWVHPPVFETKETAVGETAVYDLSQAGSVTFVSERNDQEVTLELQANGVEQS